ncbi:hypothetical protein [Paenibacillus sp. DS2015]|uniref:hypothetical protein n=1 Tax=Paenibacillus sp. DS2015 TaxID=3373917 RepID=UPI003D24E6F1
MLKGPKRKSISRLAESKFHWLREFTVNPYGILPLSGLLILAGQCLLLQGPKLDDLFINKGGTAEAKLSSFARQG